MSAARLLVANLPATAAIVAAGPLAFYGRDGWGWFLLVALLFGGTTFAQSERTAPLDAG